MEQIDRSHQLIVEMQCGQGIYQRAAEHSCILSDPPAMASMALPNVYVPLISKPGDMAPYTNIQVIDSKMKS